VNELFICFINTNEGSYRKMASKYGKYILSEPHAPTPNLIPIPGMTPEVMKKMMATAPPTIKVNSNLIKTIGLDFAFVGTIKPSDPAQPGHPSHTHDVDEYIWFHGANPANLLDFGAEIEITLGAGKDAEKHIINKASVVYVPKGLPHLPITFKKVDKPIFWGHILVAPDYTETRL
jgi:hypothetical protein